MKRIFVCLLIVFAAIATAHAAQSDLPDWVLPELSRYPVETFLFDVGRDRGIGEKSFEIAAEKPKRTRRNGLLPWSGAFLTPTAITCNTTW